MEIFLHIPKTAGSTLNHVIQHQYPAPGAVFSIDHWDPRQAARCFHALNPARQGQARLIKGHVHFGLHEYLQKPASYFTLLRDPVERVISHYYYVRGTPSHQEHATVVSQRMTLEDYVGSGTYPELDNGQARMLAGTLGLYDRTRFGQCGEDLLALALENLDRHFGVVGLQERFDDTLLLLRDVYGWSAPYYVAKNVTRVRPRRDEVPKDTRDLIRAFNQIDARLYAHVAQRFHAEIACRGQAFAVERNRFQAANARYGQVYRRVEAVGLSVGRLVSRLKR